MPEPSSSFLDQLRKPRPDPGGGAAAAYGACVGLALLEKIVQLERNRQHRTGEKVQVWADLLHQIRRLTTDLSRLQEEDVQAYAALAAARSEPHASGRLAAAVEEAIRCPAAILRKCLSASHLVAEIAAHCQKHLLADLLVANELLGAAGAGAYHIARANLPLLHVQVVKERHRKKLAELVGQLYRLRQGANEKLAQHIY